MAITNQVLKTIKRLTDGSLTGIYVQIELRDGDLVLTYDTELHPSKEADLNTAIAEFIGEKTVDFEEIKKTRDAVDIEKARKTEIQVDVKTIHINQDKVKDKADQVRDAKEVKEVEVADIEVSETPEPPTP